MATARQLVTIRQNLALYERLEDTVCELGLHATQLRHQASHDSLTGLANRSAMLETLAAALARHERSGRTLAVLVCDVDHVKDVNDTMAHPASDTVLTEVAARLRSLCRCGDTVGRMGGDGLVVVTEDLDGVDGATA